MSKKISELENANAVSLTDLHEVSVLENNKYKTKKQSLSSIANAVMNAFSFSSLRTTNKTIVSAINELKDSGGGGGGGGSDVPNANINIAEEYNSNELYNIGDYVINNDELYKCIEETIPPEIFDDNKWERILITDELKSDGDDPEDNFKADKIWQKHVGSEMIQTSPALGTNANGKEVIAYSVYDKYGEWLIDKKDGQTIALFPSFSDEHYNPSFPYASPIILGDINNDNKTEYLYFSLDGEIACYNESSSVIWKQYNEFRRIGTGTIGSISEYSYGRTTIYDSDSTKVFPDFFGVRSQDDLSRNAKIQLFKSGSPYSPVAEYEVLYAYGNHIDIGEEIDAETITSLENGTYKIVPKFKEDGAFYNSGTLSEENGNKYLYITEMDFICKKINISDGSVVWNYNTRDSCRTAPLIEDIDDDGVLECIFTSDTKFMYVLNAENGYLKWSYDFKNKNYAPISMLHKEAETENIEILKDGIVVADASSGFNGNFTYNEFRKSYYDSLEVEADDSITTSISAGFGFQVPVSQEGYSKTINYDTIQVSGSYRIYTTNGETEGTDEMSHIGSSLSVGFNGYGDKTIQPVMDAEWHSFSFSHDVSSMSGGAVVYFITISADETFSLQKAVIELEINEIVGTVENSAMNLVLIPAEDGCVHFIETNNSSNYKTYAKSTSNGENKGSGVSILNNGNLVVGGGFGKVLCFDNNGNTIWIKDLKSPIEATPIVFTNQENNKQYIIACTMNGYVYILSSDGEEVGSFYCNGAIKGTPVLVNSAINNIFNLIIVTCSGYVYYYKVTI